MKPPGRQLAEGPANLLPCITCELLERRREPHLPASEAGGEEAGLAELPHLEQREEGVH